MPEQPRKRAQKRGRRRRKRGRGPDRRPPEVRAKKGALDLEADKTRPLSEAEVGEAEAHLAFIRRYKKALRIGLNAKEDLLVNQARAPADRGVLKHLFKKIDAAAIEQALAREPLASDPKARLTFLAGVARMEPTAARLLQYLEALLEVKDRSEAARTLDDIAVALDVDKLSSSQLTKLLELVTRVFSGHDRTRAWLGLLSNTGFGRAIIDLSHKDSVPSAELVPLAHAYHTVVAAEALPRDGKTRGHIAKGLDIWLKAPAQTLRSHSESVRRSLVAFALKDHEVTSPSTLSVIGALLDSLPRSSEAYRDNARLFAERLMAKGETERAQGLLDQLVDAAQGRGEADAARRARDAMGWPRIGNLTVDRPKGAGLRRGFSLVAGTFVWVRVGAKDAVVREGQLQLNLHLPGIATALHIERSGNEGAIAFPNRGRPLKAEAPRNPIIALEFALQGVEILRALGLDGIELSRLDFDSFLLLGRNPGKLLLADFSGAKRTDTDRASLGHGEVARRWAARALSGVEETSLQELRRQLERPAPLLVTAKRLYEARAQLDG